jgi:Domain of unknown function (DUF4167)
MRQGPNNRRSRGRGSRRPHASPRQQTYDSAGPDIRIRGNAYQVLEKYLAMARDAASAGDRIAAENFYQHAEHYYRIINANGGGDQGGQNGRHRPLPRPDGQDVVAFDGQQVDGAEGNEAAGNQPRRPNPADDDEPTGAPEDSADA